MSIEICDRRGSHWQTYLITDYRMASKSNDKQYFQSGALVKVIFKVISQN